MPLLEQITADYKEAMKTKNEEKKIILNYLLAQIKNKRIETQQEPTDADIISLIKKEVKAVVETISFLEKAEKNEEKESELFKKAVLERYLPQMMNTEETEKFLDQMISELSITDLKSQRGMIMKKIKEDGMSTVDGALLNDLINKKLSQ
ncbi:GatB/YqeY domain-containing protein [bacterium]|nr:GatB/YqeY domain-containing protein [bacterium]